MIPSEPDYLYRISTTGVSTRWRLPETTHNGFLSQVKLDSNGKVWVTEEYRLVRFDPVTEQMTSLILPVESQAAFNDALESDNPMPGTWISSIAPIADGVLVARQNVPQLIRVSSDLKVIESVQVPDDYAGARDLAIDGDTTYALTGQSRGLKVGLLKLDGTLISEAAVPGLMPESRFQGSGSQIIVSGTAGIASRIEVIQTGMLTAEPVLPISIPSDRSLAAIGPDGGTVVWNAKQGAIQRVETGRVVSQLSMEKQPGLVFPPPQADGGAAPAQSILIPPMIDALAVDNRGWAWYSIAGEDLIGATPLPPPADR